MVPGGPNGEYRCSKVRVKNFFPVEPGFAITIYKAQGRTIPKVILAISERKGNGCGLNYRSIYVAFSRVKQRDDIRLLLFDDDGSRSSLTYLTKLKADPCNVAFVDGFDDNGGKFNEQRVLNRLKDFMTKR
jgi:ATP-dependent exoDNAse (exonuclease V) alpha subunit